MSGISSVIHGLDMFFLMGINGIVYPMVNGGSDQRSKLGVFIFPTNKSYELGSRPWSYEQSFLTI